MGQKRQRIAVWSLLYRLQLPSTYESRIHSVQHSQPRNGSSISSKIRPEEEDTSYYCYHKLSPMCTHRRGQRIGVHSQPDHAVSCSPVTFPLADSPDRFWAIASPAVFNCHADIVSERRPRRKQPACENSSTIVPAGLTPVKAKTTLGASTIRHPP